MRYLPIVLLLGILANFICVVVFRLKLDRRYQSEFNELSHALHVELMTFSRDALARVDSYFASNKVNSVNSVSSVSSSSSSDPTSVLFRDSGECDYYYYVYNGDPVARIGISDFRIGYPFPKGGAITAIFPDFLIVDNSLSFRNRSYKPYSSDISYTSFRPAQVYDNSSKPVKPNESSKELKSHVY